MQIQQRLDKGDVILLDGAMGTELERRGAPMDKTAWSARALLTHSDLVRTIHEDYIRAGADIITTHSFTTAKHVLEPAGMGNHFQQLNTLAVQLAREAIDNAADRPITIAASMSTFPARLDHSNDPAEDKARANYREQAEILAEAGADFVIMEMVRDIQQATFAIEAAVATGLPVWLGFSCKLADDGTVMMWDEGHTLNEGLAQLPALGATLVGVMHTLVEDVPPALDKIKARWDGPIAVYAHSGQFVMPNWQFIDMVSPEDYAAEANRWVDMGVQVIGGCCGITPEHIRVLKDQLPEAIK